MAPGLYVRQGLDEDLTASNQDAIANIGFVVGNEAVAVIDPGGSRADGERLRVAIRAVTRLPIRYVVFSHIHPDHVFGAQSFEQDRPQFIGHAQLPRALALKGAWYRDRLERTLGPQHAGTVVTPTVLVKDRLQVDLGRRKLTLTAHAIAHTNCDLSVFDTSTATLWAGDLLFVRRVPSLDGSLKGWLGELAKLARQPARRAVPGHGPTSVDWPAGARDLERYLNTLLRETREAIAKGVDLQTATRTVAQAERARWALFDDYNGHNVTQAFKELEWDS